LRELLKEFNLPTTAAAGMAGETAGKMNGIGGEEEGTHHPHYQQQQQQQTMLSPCSRSSSRDTLNLPSGPLSGSDSGFSSGSRRVSNISECE
ncbi:MAG: hypothetical protein GY826_39810, partial [Fuerstiella sp.]|nr:hypothetical protein [Fuerstiella sp.]